VGKERARAAPAPAETILEGYQAPAWKGATTLWGPTRSTPSRGPQGRCVLQSSTCRRPSWHEAARLSCRTTLAKVHPCWELIHGREQLSQELKPSQPHHFHSWVPNTHRQQSSFNSAVAKTKHHAAHATLPAASEAPERLPSCWRLALRSAPGCPTAPTRHRTFRSLDLFCLLQHSVQWRTCSMSQLEAAEGSLPYLPGQGPKASCRPPTKSVGSHSLWRSLRGTTSTAQQRMGLCTGCQGLWGQRPFSGGSPKGAAAFLQPGAQLGRPPRCGARPDAAQDPGWS